MIRLLLILLMVSAMPSSAEARKKHAHHHRIRHTHVVYEPVRTRLPPKEVAPASVEPFDWRYYQPPVRWGDVDVSTVLKPMEFIVFPPDPAPFRLPADPPVVEQYHFYDVFPKLSYTFALLIMLSTCHKACAGALTRVSKRPKWMPSSVWRQREALRNLT